MVSAMTRSHHQKPEMKRKVKSKGLRVIVAFEGREGGGTGGAIKAITERVSPRVFRVVALPALSTKRANYQAPLINQRVVPEKY